MTEQEKIAPHAHRWLMYAPDPTSKPEIIANSSCDICGLTPEAVANEAAIKALLRENAALREIVQVVANGRVVHAETVDAWVLLLENQTISYNMELQQRARTLLGE